MYRVFTLHPFATINVISGRWLVTNPSKFSAVEAESDFLKLLAHLSNIGPTFNEDQLGRTIQELGGNFSDASIVGNILIESGIALEESSQLTKKNSLNFDVSRYLSFRYAVPHEDYTRPEVFIDDQAEMETYLSSNDYPQHPKLDESQPAFFLEHPAFPTNISRPHSNLDTWIYWSFGAVRQATFLNVLDILLKFFPSKGARHPFDVYIWDIEGQVYEQGLYRYYPLEHAISRIENHAPISLASVHSRFQILITVNFERYQWRYRHSWAYKDIYFDLGHILEHCCQVSRNYGVKMKHKLFPSTENFNNWLPLVEELVLQLEVEL